MLQRTTLYDIARMANVSLDIVERVALGHQDVPNDIRTRVLTVMKLVETFGLTTKSSAEQRTIAVIVPGQVIDDYVGMVVQGIQETASRYNFTLTLNVQTPTRVDRLDTLFGESAEGAVAGVIAVVPYNFAQVIGLCDQHQLPYVLIDYQGTEPLDQALTVEVGNYDAMQQVVQHLIALGHRRIAFITGWLEHGSARQRFESYLDTLAQAGIPYDPALVIEGNWLHQAAYEATTALLHNGSEPPTAIVASNDLSAFGAMQAIKEAGYIVGEHISVTGFDDISMAAIVSPSLTTVRQPSYQLGEVAVEMLVKRLQGEPVLMPHVRLETEFIVRESTGPAPGAHRA